MAKTDEKRGPELEVKHDASPAGAPVTAGDGPLPPGRFYALFEFVDGITLRFYVADATASGSDADPMLARHWWVFSRGPEILDQGPFTDPLRSQCRADNTG